MRRGVRIVLAALCLGATPLLAQPRPPAPPPAAAQGGAAIPQQDTAPEPLPPYNGDLLNLSQTMGAIAFLRTLCTGSDEPVWRERMASLIESEAKTVARREMLAGAYNQGFRGYALTYRTCTESAQEALVRLARDGERLSRALSGRFGG
jgi:uncharacterized protein (TIGR02301 family)